MIDSLTLVLIAVVLLILVGVIVLLFSSRSVKEKPPLHVAEAFHLLLSGRRNEALSLLTQLIREEDAPAVAFLHLGDLLREQREPARALALHEGLLARPQLQADLRRLAELSVTDDLMALGRVEECQKRLQALQKLFKDESILQRRARALHRLGRIDEAAKLLIERAGMEDLPEFSREASRYLAETGRQALLESDLEAALKRGEKALRLDATNPAAHALLGDVFQGKGQGERAMKIWRDGLITAPADGGLLLPRLLEASFRLGKMESLLEELEDLRSEAPEQPVLWKAVTDLRLRRGDLESFFALVEHPPTEIDMNGNTWLGWIRHLSASGDPAHLKRLLKCLPDSFGPEEWACRHCGAREGELRLICVQCGRLDPLVPAPSVPKPEPRLLPEMPS